MIHYPVVFLVRLGPSRKMFFGILNPKKSLRLPEKLAMGWGNPKQPMKLQQPRNYDFWNVPIQLSVATPAEPRGEKKLFFVQIFGGEKLFKFVEKCR